MELRARHSMTPASGCDVLLPPSSAPIPFASAFAALRDEAGSAAATSQAVADSGPADVTALAEKVRKLCLRCFFG
jgi:hypothetical protein